MESTEPILPPGVVVCDGIPRSSWHSKVVTLQNEGGDDIANGICRNVDADAVFDMDGKPLGDDKVAIHIAESLNEEEMPRGSELSLVSWPIKRVYLNGISLYDHEQNHLVNVAKNALSRPPRKGIRSYESSRERHNPDVPPKKETLLTPAAIAGVSLKSCCANNCCQPFPRGHIHTIRSQLHLNDGFYNRKKCCLEVHRQIHKDASGKEWITLKGREICPRAWYIIHGISKASFYRYKRNAAAGKQAEGHGNLGSKKPRTHTIQATSTLRMLIEGHADRMPHKTRTTESGEKVTAMVLPSAFRWSDQLQKINETNASFNLKPISSSGLSNIRRDSFPEYAPKARGDSFSRCSTCDEYKQMRSACVPQSRGQLKYTKQLSIHNAQQMAHRVLYYSNRAYSEEYPEKMITIIHDKMDHAKTASPQFSHKTKTLDSFMKMPVAVTGMIAHGHGDIRYAHFGLDMFPTDSNHTVGSIAKLLRDLEGQPRNSSRKLFSLEEQQSKLTKAILGGWETCLDSLLPPPQDAEPAKPLPPILTLQLDNASGDNKNRWVFAFCSLLVYKGIFREVFINFLMVGHTHEDIDALFGRWSLKLKTNSFSTVTRLMKSFMDSESQPVIPHFIEEVPDFKKFVEGYLGTDGDILEGHSGAQQFKFYMDSNGWPLMEYKHYCTDAKWLPEHGKGIRLWSETNDDRPLIPKGSPLPLVPTPIGSIEEVKKGLNGFISYWNRMADDDYTGEFRRMNDPIKNYWKGVRAALDEPMQVRQSLQDGFWPASRIAPDETDQLEDDGTLAEGYAEDVLFVGRRRDRPRPSYRVGIDTKAGYFVVVRPADGDLKPFWLARALTDPSPNPAHVNQIRIQYWTPIASEHINAETYVGWDTKKGNAWHEDKLIPPSWSSTNCLMTAWKPYGRKGVEAHLQVIGKVKIPKAQISIIKESVAAFMSASDNDAA